MRRFVARLVVPLLAILALAGCGGRGGGTYGGGGEAFAPSRYYPPPGPRQDPWGPYIREAAARFQLPEQWIRAVMRQESGGQEQAISSAGAMGLMQVMPATYEGLRARYGLGDDPYDPHNNLLAGTAYLREMYDRYGAPGFLAAYNAGPRRVDSYLAGASDLPEETVNYVAAISPNLGTEIAFSGPLAVYAGSGADAPPAAPVNAASFAAGCDTDAAYDPDHPCAPLERAAATPAAVVVPVPSADCDADAAFDPQHPCAPLPPTEAANAAPAVVASEVPQSSQAAQTALYQPRAVSPPTGGAWGIQVGAFASPVLARAVAEGARTEAAADLAAAVLTLPTTPVRGATLYRARLVGLSQHAATDACARLNRLELPCVVVRPLVLEAAGRAG